MHIYAYFVHIYAYLCLCIFWHIYPYQDIYLAYYAYFRSAYLCIFSFAYFCIFFAYICTWIFAYSCIFVLCIFLYILAYKHIFCIFHNFHLCILCIFSAYLVLHILRLAYFEMHISASSCILNIYTHILSLVANVSYTLHSDTVWTLEQIGGILWKIWSLIQGFQG